MGKVRPVRRPVVALDARGQVAVHGRMLPVRVHIHDTESHDYAGIRDLQGIIDYWKTVSWGPGAHLIIDKDGNTALCADADKLLYHTENRNTGAIGIELVGFAKFTPKLWFLRIKQLRECAKWIAYYNADWGVPIRFSTERGVSGHRHQSKKYGGSHWDPGYGFKFGWLIRQAHKYRARGWV